LEAYPSYLSSYFQKRENAFGLQRRTGSDEKERYRDTLRPLFLKYMARCCFLAGEAPCSIQFPECCWEREGFPLRVSENRQKQSGSIPVRQALWQTEMIFPVRDIVSGRVCIPQVLL